jgi:hypothetical protein
VLLVASGTLVQSLRTFGRDETGLDAQRVSVAVMGISANGHVPRSLDSARAVFASRIAALPDVGATARALHAPFTSWWPLLPVAPWGDHAAYVRLPYNLVTPRYFDVVGQHLVSGRMFSPDDSSSNAPVAIVTPAAARRLWPASQAIGQTLRVAVAQDEPDRIVRVVGLVSDAQSGMIWDWDASGYVYLPATRQDLSNAEMPLLIRSDARQPEVARAVEGVAREVDANSPLLVEPLLAARTSQLVPFRYGAFITSAVGAFGLGLALIGLYGVVSFAVTQRRRELAVHIALGAKPRDVLRLVLRREMRLVLVGLAAGLVMAAGEARLLESMLIPLATLGIGGLLAIAGLLLIVACLATLAPAAQALRIAPMQVLRQD